MASCQEGLLGGLIMNAEEEKIIEFRIHRFDPDGNESRLSVYKVPTRVGMTILDVLNYIKDNLDGTLTFRQQCRMGQCGSCGITVNGKPMLACYTQVLQLEVDTLEVEPLANLPVIKDLVVDVDRFLEKYAKITSWRMLCSGAISASIMMGWKAASKMGTVFKPVDKDRQENMTGCAFLYPLVIGVATGMQGKGFGRKLIDAAIEKSEREGLHLYLETETEENVRMYEHFGFRLLKRITLPIVNLPMWEMVREPKV